MRYSLFYFTLIFLCTTAAISQSKIHRFLDLKDDTLINHRLIDRQFIDLVTVFEDVSNTSSRRSIQTTKVAIDLKANH